jgi:hypothetical protein
LPRGQILSQVQGLFGFQTLSREAVEGAFRTYLEPMGAEVHWFFGFGFVEFHYPLTQPGILKLLAGLPPEDVADPADGALNGQFGSFRAFKNDLIGGPPIRRVFGEDGLDLKIFRKFGRDEDLNRQSPQLPVLDRVEAGSRHYLVGRKTR